MVGPGSLGTQNDCKTDALGLGKGVCMHVCALHCPKENHDLRIYEEDSAQEGTNVFCDRGKQKRANAGHSPNQQKFTEHYRSKSPFSSADAPEAPDWSVCGDAGCRNKRGA